MSRARLIGVSALAVCVLSVATAPAVAAQAASDVTHEPPVEAPILDPFRPPSSPFGAGNRGLLYDTLAGTPVTATADGVVVFAGQVGGSLHVTLRHHDGVRTSYSFLAEIDVVIGQRVDRGQVLGITAGPLHLGARLGDAYFDPAALFSRATVEVHLVAFDMPFGNDPDGERGAIRALIGGLTRVGEAAANRLLSASGATVDWLEDNGAVLARTFLHYAVPLPIRLASTGYQVWTDAQAVARRPCTAAGVAAPSPPAERRLAVAVAGLGSTSDGGAGVDQVDYARLGYEQGDVVRFSYRGGRTPGSGGSLSGIPAADYDKSDTQQDLHVSAARLADLIEDVVARSPGIPMDIYGHSQGGVVARLAIEVLVERHGSAWVDQIDELMMLAAPNQGADLATGVTAFGSTERGSLIFDAAGTVMGLDDDADNVAQLSEVSDLVRDLRDTPIPAEVDAISIGARGDPIVALPRTQAPGALSVAVPLAGPAAHGDLPGSSEALREMQLALADRPPTCRTFSGALIDGALGEGISLAEDQLSALGWAWAAIRSGGKPFGG